MSVLAHTYYYTPMCIIHKPQRHDTGERFPYHNIIVEVHKIIIVIALSMDAHTVMCWVLIQTNIM